MEAFSPLESIFVPQQNSNRLRSSFQFALSRLLVVRNLVETHFSRTEYSLQFDLGNGFFALLITSFIQFFSLSVFFFDVKPQSYLSEPVFNSLLIACFYTLGSWPVALCILLYRYIRKCQKTRRTSINNRVHSQSFSTSEWILQDDANIASVAAEGVKHDNTTRTQHNLLSQDEQSNTTPTYYRIPSNRRSLLQPRNSNFSNSENQLSTYFRLMFNIENWRQKSIQVALLFSLFFFPIFFYIGFLFFWIRGMNNIRLLQYLLLRPSIIIWMAILSLIFLNRKLMISQLGGLIAIFVSSAIVVASAKNLWLDCTYIFLSFLFGAAYICCSEWRINKNLVFCDPLIYFGLENFVANAILAFGAFLLQPNSLTVFSLLGKNVKILFSSIVFIAATGLNNIFAIANVSYITVPDLFLVEVCRIFIAFAGFFFPALSLIFVSVKPVGGSVAYLILSYIFVNIGLFLSIPNKTKLPKESQVEPNANTALSSNKIADHNPVKKDRGFESHIAIQLIPTSFIRRRKHFFHVSSTRANLKTFRLGGTEMTASGNAYHTFELREPTELRSDVIVASYISTSESTDVGTCAKSYVPVSNELKAEQSHNVENDNLTISTSGSRELVATTSSVEI